MIDLGLRPEAAASARPVTAGYKVDTSRGERIGRVSSEWFSARMMSASCRWARSMLPSATDPSARRHARSRRVRSRVEASRDKVERLALIVPGRSEPVAPTNWSFGQMCSLVGAPASYLRQLPAPLAGYQPPARPAFAPRGAGEDVGSRGRTDRTARGDGSRLRPDLGS